MTSFRTVADTARETRTESDAMKLVEEYAAMGCAVYPTDVALFLELWGGPPPGWTWDRYERGHGGFTSLRKTDQEGAK